MLICALSVLLGVYAYEYLLWTKEYKYNVEGSFNEALRLRAHGEDVVPLLFPHLYISKNSGSPFLPLSGPSRANMVGVNESGFWPRLLTDEFGFNNLPDAHQANPDILLIGDSLTQGMNVESFDNLAGQLAKREGES